MAGARSLVLDVAVPAHLLIVAMPADLVAGAEAQALGAALACDPRPSECGRVLDDAGYATAAAPRLCDAPCRRMDDDRIWVWYTVAPFVPLSP